MIDIEVVAVAPDAFQVVVDDGRSSSTHHVTADPGDVDRIAHGADAEALVEASFRFLLEREPKESILPSFDLTVISRYFPEYESKVGDHL